MSMPRPNWRLTAEHHARRIAELERQVEVDTTQIADLELALREIQKLGGPAGLQATAALAHAATEKRSTPR